MDSVTESEKSAMKTEALDELVWLPAWRCAELVASGEVSAVELVRAHLDRIDRVDPVLHSFITVAADEALAAAAAADDAVRCDDHLPPLHGVPVALKDEIWTRGIRSTGGSLIYEDFTPSVDAPVVERLRHAGAIVIGKTQMPEFAMWPRSLNRVSPECRNPWDVERISGASSGGSAAAVASGMTPLAIGSDGGGSTRIPSAPCGAVGLHPTPGTVPSEHTFSYSPFASLGPIARTVRDAALLLAAMTGRVANGRLREDVADLDSGIDGLRVAWSGDYGWIPADPRVVEKARDAILVLESAGAIIEEPGLVIDDVWPVFALETSGASIYSGGPVPYVASEENLERCLARPDLLMPGIEPLLTALRPTLDEYREADEVVQRVLDDVRSLLTNYDVICSPTMPTVAPLIPEGWGSPYPDERMGTSYTSIVNLLRGTAATYPCGLIDGLPVGLHIASGPLAESTVLRSCRALELQLPWDLHAPA